MPNLAVTTSLGRALLGLVVLGAAGIAIAAVWAHKAEYASIVRRASIFACAGLAVSVGAFCAALVFGGGS